MLAVRLNSHQPSAPPGHQTPSPAWWRDAALAERKPTSGARGLCHWAGELTARQAAEPPSRRAAECASASKPSPPRPHRPQGQFETHPAKIHVHTPPCSAFRLHSSPTRTRLLAILSGQNHPVLWTQAQPSDWDRIATALSGSGHSTAKEEHAPSAVALPPTSLHAIVWCVDTPVL